MGDLERHEATPLGLPPGCHASELSGLPVSRKSAGVHTRLLIALLASTGSLGTGCCIPLPGSQTVTPALDVTVTSGGRALPDARVQLVRYEYHPHFRPETARVAQASTGADGRASFERVDESETTYPLMMHGVPGYGWQVCVDVDGFRSAVQGLRPEAADGAQQVRFDLQPGDGERCDGLLGRTRLQPGEVRTTPAPGAPSNDPGP